MCTRTPRRMRTSSRFLATAALVAASLSSACGSLEDALTAHARPAATAVGLTLSSGQLAAIVAESTVPDSMLTGPLAAQIARLWADYVVLASIYEEPDSVEAVDLGPLLEDGRYFDAVAVQEFRNSVLLSAADPTEEEVRAYFEERQPFTRLDLRRIRLAVPADASEAQRDSVYDAARALRERLAGGADFVEVAREVSDDPEVSRGRILVFQGHENVPSVADSALFAMRPGEISPVFSTDEGMMIYRVEQRRAPEFERAHDMTYDRMVEERRDARQRVTVDSLLDAAARRLTDGAAAVAGRIATDPEMAEGAVRDATPLVRYEGGVFTAKDLRTLFRARPDMRDRFAQAGTEDVEDFLLQLAADAVLVAEARERGFGPTETQKTNLAAAVHTQLARIAERYGISHELVRNPSFDRESAALRFLNAVLAAREPVPWLTEFRPVVQPGWPSQVDGDGCLTAAELARNLRSSESETTPAEEAGEAAAPSADEHGAAGTTGPDDGHAGDEDSGATEATR